MDTSAIASAASAFASVASAIAAVVAAAVARREFLRAHGDFLTVRVAPAVENGLFLGAVVSVRNRSRHAVTVANVWIVPARRKGEAFAVLTDTDGKKVGFPHALGAWESLRVLVPADRLEGEKPLIPFRAFVTLDDGQRFRARRRFGRRDLDRVRK